MSGLLHALWLFAAAFVSLVVVTCRPAAAADCTPHCDYVHDYGPYDFSQVRPGLFGYPVCDRQGNCAPHLVYREGGRPFGQVTITVRPTREWRRRRRGD